MLLAGLLALALRAHPDSLSSARVEVAGREVHARLRFQALSLFEVRPELDLDRDRVLSSAEVAAGGEEIGRYLLAAWQLRAGDATAPFVPGRLERLVPEDPATLGAFDLQRVEAELVFEGAAELERVTIESRLFHETNPFHRDLVSVAWPGEEAVAHTFEGQGEGASFTFEPAHVRRPGVFTQFVKLGIDHIRTGFDHQAFLLALLVASRRVRSLIGVVTAFTVAHSLTLACAALGWVHVQPRFVELAIALSIAYVACDNLLRRTARNPWPEAFFFGLLHGLGFAGFLSDALAGEPLVVTALFGFNLGVELGQLALVLAVSAVIALLFRAHRQAVQSEGAEPGLVPARVRTVVSLLVALAGFYWFVERAGWLRWG